jgi:alpha-tubulin suppressor-like RCC1 family protein
VVTAKGDLYTFGCGQHNRLGMGDMGFDAHNSAVPTEVPTLRKQDIKHVAVGGFHMAAVTDSGAVFTWGRPSSGALGHANAAPGIPTAVDPAHFKGEKVVSVEAGRGHTLALTASGKVFSWGSGTDGALGHGDKIARREPTEVTGVAAAGGGRAVAIACGRDFSMVLLEDGTLQSFGADDYGQLGQGRVSRYVRKPQNIAALREEGVVSIAAGEFHAAAVTADGRVFSWGMGKEGQLGHGLSENRSHPLVIEALEGKAISKVSCGGGHTAFVGANGALLVCGRGRSGQLGQGDTGLSVAAYRTVPAEVSVCVCVCEDHDRVE